MHAAEMRRPDPDPIAGIWTTSEASLMTYRMIGRLHGVMDAIRGGVFSALRDTRGATAMEYGLIGVGIALTLVVATFALGDEVVGLFGDIQETFASKRS